VADRVQGRQSSCRWPSRSSPRGVIFRLVYDQDPSRGLANAVVTSVGRRRVPHPPGDYPGGPPLGSSCRAPPPRRAATSPGAELPTGTTRRHRTPGDPAGRNVPKDAAPRARARRGPSRANWRGGDLARLHSAVVAVSAGSSIPPSRVSPHVPGGRRCRAGDEIASSEPPAGPTGTFTMQDVPARVQYRVRLAASKLPRRAVRRGGVGSVPGSSRPSIIARVPLDLDRLRDGDHRRRPRPPIPARGAGGGTDRRWHRNGRCSARSTVPTPGADLAWSCSSTLMINVLKIFDHRLRHRSRPSVQDDANVLAVEMWRVSFGGDQRPRPRAAAIAVVLFVLVVPAMLFNLRRLRGEDR